MGAWISHPGSTAEGRALYRSCRQERSPYARLGGEGSKRVSLVQFHFCPKKKAQGTVPGCPCLGTFWKDTPHLTEGISRV